MSNKHSLANSGSAAQDVGGTQNGSRIQHAALSDRLSALSVPHAKALQWIGRTFSVVLAMLCIVTLSHCGGGGGGGEDNAELHGANADVDLDPSQIKIGDRTLVRAILWEVASSGVLVKIRYPEALSYIDGTALVKVGDSRTGITPVIGPRKSKNWIYLVYLITRDSVGDDNYGELFLQLRGVILNSAADVEVDLDLHNPALDPDEEFRVREPFYSAEDSTRVEIIR